jgi:hypothetical protein
MQILCTSATGDVQECWKHSRQVVKCGHTLLLLSGCGRAVERLVATALFVEKVGRGCVGMEDLFRFSK